MIFVLIVVIPFVIDCCRVVSHSLFSAVVATQLPRSTEIVHRAQRGISLRRYEQSLRILFPDRVSYCLLSRGILLPHPHLFHPAISVDENERGCTGDVKPL